MTLMLMSGPAVPEAASAAEVRAAVAQLPDVHGQVLWAVPAARRIHWAWRIWALHHPHLDMPGCEGMLTWPLDHVHADELDGPLQPMPARRRPLAWQAETVPPPPQIPHDPSLGNAVIAWTHPVDPDTQDSDPWWPCLHDPVAAALLAEDMYGLVMEAGSERVRRLRRQWGVFRRTVAPLAVEYFAAFADTVNRDIAEADGEPPEPPEPRRRTWR